MSLLGYHSLETMHESILTYRGTVLGCASSNMKLKEMNDTILELPLTKYVPETLEGQHPIFVLKNGLRTVPHRSLD